MGGLDICLSLGEEFIGTKKACLGNGIRRSNGEGINKCSPCCRYEAPYYNDLQSVLGSSADMGTAWEASRWQDYFSARQLAYTLNMKGFGKRNAEMLHEPIGSA